MQVAVVDHNRVNQEERVVVEAAALVQTVVR
jgi:hypothetical protein